MKLLELLESVDQNINENLVYPIAYALAMILKFALYYFLLGFILFILAHIVYKTSSFLYPAFSRKVKEFTEPTTIFVGPFIFFICIVLPAAFVWVLILFIFY